jgi:hypothetical protein
MIGLNTIATPGLRLVRSAEDVLSNLPALNKFLASPEADLETVRSMIKVEADGRHRMTTLQRLVARHNVLEAKANEEEVMAYVSRIHGRKGL